ncbi:MAG: DUF1573 domain-containing protein [bacterium]
MKLSALGVLLVILLLTCGSIFAAPQMVLSESSFDFGFVPQNSKISHTFWIKSVGDDDLKILKVVPGCSCTQAPLKKNEVAVGDSTSLEIIFSTKQYKSLVTKHPKIQTNEGSGDKTLTFVSNVISNPDSTYPLIINPFIVNFAQEGDKKNDNFVVNLTNVTEQDLDIVLIDQPDNIFELKLPEKIKAGQTAKASIKLNDDAKSLSFEKSITIGVNDTNKSRFTIPVKQNMSLSKKD